VAIKLSYIQKLQYGLVATTFPLRSKEARRWIMQQIANVGGRINAATLIKQSPRERKKLTFTRSMVGKMYFFFYDPKTKEDLDFYDKFPLVFPIQKYADGFLGINFHYLPLRYRAVLLDKIEVLANNKRMDETTRLRLTYELLNTVPKYRLFKPCLKRYLWEQIRSPLLHVTPDQWDVAIFLPAERFVGAQKQEVFRDSITQVFTR